MEVRFQEVESSVTLIEQALRTLPTGPARTELGGFVRDCALGAAESARGETLYWLEAAGSRSLRFCKLRAASFMNFGIFEPGV